MSVKIEEVIELDWHHRLLEVLEYIRIQIHFTVSDVISDEI